MNKIIRLAILYCSLFLTILSHAGFFTNKNILQKYFLTIMLPVTFGVGGYSAFKECNNRTINQNDITGENIPPYFKWLNKNIINPFIFTAMSNQLKKNSQPEDFKK